MEQNKHPGITAKFNGALFLFFAVVSAFQYIMSSDEVKNASPAGLILSIILDALVVFLILLVCAAWFKVFWDRLISNISNLRNISYQESLAVVLIISILGI